MTPRARAQRRRTLPGSRIGNAEDGPARVVANSHREPARRHALCRGRASCGAGRPWSGGDPRRTWRRMRDAQRPAPWPSYRGMADADAVPDRGVWFVTRGGARYWNGSEPGSLPGAALWGLGRVVAREAPQLQARMVDLDPRGRGAARRSDRENCCSPTRKATSRIGAVVAGCSPARAAGHRRGASRPAGRFGLDIGAGTRAARSRRSKCSPWPLVRWTPGRCASRSRRAGSTSWMCSARWAWWRKGSSARNSADGSSRPVPG